MHSPRAELQLPHVPTGMRGKLIAALALRDRPLIPARRAPAGGVKRVPNETAGRTTDPPVDAARLPLANRAADFRPGQEQSWRTTYKAQRICYGRGHRNAVDTFAGDHQNHPMHVLYRSWQTAAIGSPAAGAPADLAIPSYLEPQDPAPPACGWFSDPATTTTGTRLVGRAVGILLASCGLDQSFSATQNAWWSRRPDNQSEMRERYAADTRYCTPVHSRAQEDPAEYPRGPNGVLSGVMADTVEPLFQLKHLAPDAGTDVGHSGKKLRQTRHLLFGRC